MRNGLLSREMTQMELKKIHVILCSVVFHNSVGLLYMEKVQPIRIN